MQYIDILTDQHDSLTKDNHQNYRNVHCKKLSQLLVHRL